MAYGVKRKATALSKSGVRAAKRRRMSNVSKAQRQKPTAANQKRQIIRNAKAVSHINRLIRQSRIYCDWQLKGQLNAEVPGTGTPPAYTQTWVKLPLSDFSLWRPVMRTDTNVEDASRTYWSRMQLNLRYSLDNSGYAQISCFIVTLRKQAANIDLASHTMTEEKDFILNTVDYNPRLNPALYKVHFCRHVSLMKQGWEEVPAGPGLATNPVTTLKKGQVNINPKVNVRAPIAPGTSEPKWKDLIDAQVPYNQRYFIVCYFNQRCPSGTAADTGANVTYDMLATTINQD